MPNEYTSDASVVSQELFGQSKVEKAYMAFGIKSNVGRLEVTKQDSA